MIPLKLFIFCAFAILATSAWHVCQDEAFCANLRHREPSHFALDRNTIEKTDYKSVTAILINQATNNSYRFEYIAHNDGIFRISISDDTIPKKKIPSVLREGMSYEDLEVEVKQSSIWLSHEHSVVEINLDNFEIRSANTLTNEVIYINQAKDMVVGEAHALKFKFANAHTAYGIPEHGERLVLKDTKNAEPYRLFNLDYGYYKVESPESLYGAVPVFYALGKSALGPDKAHVSGVFWNNPAQTFVDIEYTVDAVVADFITEAGTLDFFILPGGPTFKHAVKNYMELTGPAPLPPLFALGYHQSRYSYLTQDYLEDVADKLSANDFPVDVLWLDIDYTDGKRYFTWNYTAFPDPLGMQEKLGRDGRRLVTIIDPHIKAETGYWVYDQMMDGNYYVMNADGSPYEGNCWPGKSSYVDFINPDAQTWWGNLYRNFPNSTDRLCIWNDMNEPSVFDVEEKTMAKDVLHYDDIQHKEVHNMYGYAMTKGTFEGLNKRDSGSSRPFLLTRSHYAGSQRYAAIWTGDNIATWEHLRVSISICLTEALAGISFCGADVGGFIERPTEELFQRWYQLGAWYPFFRAHSNNEQDYREPYLYGKEVQTRFRNAIKQRYAHLPYWYTLWYEHEKGEHEPVMRPLIYQFPYDENVISNDEAFMIGANILVAPVLYENAAHTEVYLPNDTWYIHPSPFTGQSKEVKIYQGNASYTLDCDMDSTFVFYRGGTIIPRKDVSRNSTEFMLNDPYNFYVYLDRNDAAFGTLYVDDTVSYEYQKYKDYLHLENTFRNNMFRSVELSGNWNEDIPIGYIFVFYDTTEDTTTSNRKPYTKAIFNNNNNNSDKCEDCKEFPVTYNATSKMVSIELNIKLSGPNFGFNITLL